MLSTNAPVNILCTILNQIIQKLERLVMGHMFLSFILEKQEKANNNHGFYLTECFLFCWNNESHFQAIILTA